MAWASTILTSEFFWGIIVGLILTVIGSYFLALFTTWQGRRERKNVLKSFCVDTVRNIRQIIDDMDATRGKAKMIHHEYLALLDIETQVFGRNREQLIYLPLDVRDNVRKFVTDCATRRAEIGNHLTTFYNQMNLAGQFEAQGNAMQAQNIRNAAAGPLVQANRALDELVLRARDSESVIQIVTSVK
jgi:hypothetical protein